MASPRQIGRDPLARLVANALIGSLVASLIPIPAEASILGPSLPQAPPPANKEGFRFHFYSNEGQEPPDVHVEKGSAAAKVWLQPVATVYSYGFRPAELRRIREIAFEHQAALVERWNGHFGR